jgi:heme exporter protein B
MNVFTAMIKRDLRLHILRGSEGFAGVFFFIVVVSLFPFVLGGDTALLKKAASGIIWIAALLAALLPLESLYHRDADDGTFDLLLSSGISPLWMMTSKMMTHWLLSGCFLLLAALPAAVMLSLPATILPLLLLSLFLGTFYMSLLSGLGAVLTLGSRRPALLHAVLVLPLFTPMLILGALTAESALAGMSVRPYLLLQTALLLPALPLAPLAAAAFLKTSLRS